MAINFDQLPSDSPNTTPEDGRYHALIKKAEMKVGKTSGNPYLNVELALDKDGKGYGNLFDIITESDSDIQRYKLRRLIEAVNIPMKGSFELADLTKILPNKTLLVDVTTEKAKDGRPARAVVDVFTNAIYYPAPKEETKYAEVPLPSDDDLPFDATDAEDATTGEY